MKDRTKLRSISERIGRRGLVLLLFGLAWVAQGSAFFLLRDMFAEMPEHFLIDHLPLWMQGVAWVASGSLAVVSGFLPRRENDTFGFVAVSTMPLLHGASFLVGAVTYRWMGDPLWVLGLLGFLVWAPIILALAVVASWYEPPVLESKT